jgi:HAE1 family hydrophobic/amphiphilic exporter-1
VVIGGLVSSTLLTLVLVPTLYTMVENGKEKRRLKRAARRGATGPTPPPVDVPKHAADEPEAEPQFEDEQEEPVSASSGGAHEAPVTATPSAALRGYTDQFEVLKMPRRPEQPPA